MSSTLMSRRNLLAGLAVMPVFSALPAAAESERLHVYKDPSCGCCGAWIAVMQEAGFSVSVKNVSNDSLYGFKRQNGISDALASCHTGQIAGYLVEGHVPPTDVRRLLAERPDALGLTVPGMPYGAPGMGPESEREAYQVLLMRRDGSTEVFASYEAV